MLVTSLSFREKLISRILTVNSILCIGLDPHSSELQLSSANATDTEKCEAAYTFCERIITNTTSVAACYKPNVAFFEALGIGGDVILQRVLSLIPPTIPILLDAKRGDIGTTAQAYAAAAYNVYNADAITLSPFMGYDSIEPFLSGTL
jgi:uridine monophosphate synthetase